jgi:predicted nuclease of predicted toxin-antitoxin system
VRWLIDEMLPPALAKELNALGHDALTVQDIGLLETADRLIYAYAVEHDRTVVTENFADFTLLVSAALASEEPSVPVVFVRKQDHPRGGGLAVHLARHLDHWAKDHPQPYPGVHWP